MRFFRRAALAAVAMAAALAHAEQPLRDWDGRPTPPLALHDLSGRTVDLRGLQGRVVLVNFWATWCEPCIAEMPSIARLRSRLSGKPFDVLAVNYGESREKVEGFLRKEKLDVPVLLDRDQAAADAWGAKGLPMSFLVDAHGKIRYWVFGERDWSDAASRKAVDGLVAEAPRA